MNPGQLVGSQLGVSCAWYLTPHGLGGWVGLGWDVAGLGAPCDSMPYEHIDQNWRPAGGHHLSPSSAWQVEGLCSHTNLEQVKMTIFWCFFKIEPRGRTGAIMAQTEIKYGYGAAQNRPPPSFHGSV